MHSSGFSATGPADAPREDREEHGPRARAPAVAPSSAQNTSAKGRKLLIQGRRALHPVELRRYTRAEELAFGTEVHRQSRLAAVSVEGRRAAVDNEDGHVGLWAQGNGQVSAEHAKDSSDAQALVDDRDLLQLAHQVGRGAETGRIANVRQLSALLDEEQERETPFTNDGPGGEPTCLFQPCPDCHACCCAQDGERVALSKAVRERVKISARACNAEEKFLRA